MNDENKNRLVFGLKVVALVLFIGLTIITCAGVWNYNPEGFVKWCALALAICNGYLAVKYYLKIKKEYDDVVKEQMANQFKK